MNKGLRNNIWWGLLLASSLLFFFSEMVESSMYIDGVWYAVISQNLSVGKGSFWFPQFSETFFSAFHEHPPLMFGIQSLYFQALGNTWLTERFFSLSQYIGIAALIVFFWRKTFQTKPDLQKMWFIPLLFWQVNIANYYYLSANLLESPLILFDMIAIAFLWKSTETKQDFLYLLGAGFFLVLAFLTKGFVGFFPLAFLGIYWLVLKHTSFFKMIKNSLLLIFFTSILFGILFFIQPLALESLKKYLDIQVFASLNGDRRLYYFRESRFFIIGQLIISLLPMGFALVLNLLFSYFSKKEKATLSKMRSSYSFKLAIIFLLVGLSASLPIMISPRQALPYLLPSLPFFSLGFGILTAFFFKDWWAIFSKKSPKLLRILELSTILIVLIALSFCFYKYNKPNRRDAAVINDATKIGQFVGTNKIIASSHYDMYISGYLMRFNRISIDTSSLEYDFLILPKKEGSTSSFFEKINLSTQEYDLYQKKSNLTTKQ